MSLLIVKGDLISHILICAHLVRYNAHI